jgi:hypothetical protein
MTLPWFRARQATPKAIERPAPQSFVRSASTTLDATGQGFVTIVCPNNVMWEVGSSSVFTNIGAALLQTTPAQPAVSVYQDSTPNNLAFIEGTNSGDRDSSDTTYRLLPGQPITAQWVTPTIAASDHAGLLATFVIRGLQTQVVPG